ncbi:hypothetical protein D0T53_02195 [Dysgonomonas sp. 216]|nr:hypothetical protein [Dysgonomonas sp. 216]
MISCATTEFFNIEIQKPAQYPLPLDIKNVVIVDNTITQPADIGHKNIIGNSEESISVSSDSVSTVLIESLAQFLEEEKFFDKVTSLKSPLRQTGSFLHELQIDSSTVQQIAQTEEADGIISLDKLIMQSEKKAAPLGDGLTQEKMKLYIEARFRIYSAKGLLISPSILYQDTLQWENTKYRDLKITDFNPELEEIPYPRKKVLYQGAIYIGSEMVKMFTPYWENQTRWYYTNGSTNMRQAAAKASGNRWDDAASVWENLFDKETKPIKKAKLASNIAVANEMQDNIESAFEWSLQAVDLYNSVDLKNKSENDAMNEIRDKEYSKELARRVKDMELLRK